MAFDLVQNDTASVLRGTLIDRLNNRIPLYGATVVLRYKIGSSQIFEKTMSIEDADNSIVSYQFQAGDLPYAGTLYYEVKVINPDGTFIRSLDNLILSVRRALQ